MTTQSNSDALAWLDSLATGAAKVITALNPAKVQTASDQTPRAPTLDESAARQRQTPSWLLPAGIAAAVALLVIVMVRK